VSEGKRRWARIFTASSTLLLLLAIVAFLQMTDDLQDSYDPEVNNLVSLGPGEQQTFQVKTSVLITALRENIDDSNEAELRLYDVDESEVSGQSPNWRHPTRWSGDGEREYVPVRVFENVQGEYTLHNDAQLSTLWLVDDEESANVMLSNWWTFVFFFGCCFGSPIGFIGLVLAIMVWTDKRKKPDQFVVIEDGRVIIAEPGGFVDVNEEPGVPGPFVDVRIEESKEEPPEVDESDESWKGWDDG